MNQHNIDYIGDGVYVGHDGYQIWLTTGSHMNAELIALDPQVLANLVEYSDRHLGTNFTKK